METPIRVATIKELLQQMNLEAYQKHSEFHIIKREDHNNEVPRKLNFQSGDFFEITFSQSENAQINIDQLSIDVTKDHLLFLSPGQSLKVDSSGTVLTKNTYILFFTADFLDFAPSSYHIIKRFPFFNMNCLPVFYTQKEVSKLYLHYMQRIYKEFQDVNANSLEIIKSLLTIMLFETNRNLKDNLHFIPQKLSRKAEIAYQFENLIKLTEHKNQKMDFYAHKLYVSTTYLSECVKETTNKTAKTILTEYILLEAKSLLKSTTQTIEVIALKLGFKESSNFINYYKKYKGITPNQERKRG